MIPELIGVSTKLDRDWIAANVPGDPSARAGTRVSDPRTSVVRDLTTGVVEDMIALWNRAVRENPSGPTELASGTLRWSDARLERPGDPPLKVDEIEFHWRVHGGAPEVDVLRSDPAAIVRDAISGTLLFIDPDGVVRGDTDEEGIRGR